MKYEPLSDLLIQVSINTENQLMDFYDSICQDCPDTGRITGAYIIFHQGGQIYYDTPVPGLVSLSSAEIYYNAACTAGMTSAHFRILIRELLNIYPDIVP